MSPYEDMADNARDAARYRWLTKNAHVGVCYTDQVESGQILEIGGCDRRVPDEVGEFCNVGEAIDAAMAAEGASGVKGTPAPLVDWPAINRGFASAAPAVAAAAKRINDAAAAMRNVGVAPSHGGE